MYLRTGNKMVVSVRLSFPPQFSGCADCAFDDFSRSPLVRKRSRSGVCSMDGTE